MTKFSKNAAKIMEEIGKMQAINTRCRELLPEHLLLAVINFDSCVANSVLNCFPQVLMTLKKEIYKFLEPYYDNENEVESPEKVVFSRRIQTIIDLAGIESMVFAEDVIASEHILIAIIREPGSFASRFFSEAGIDLGLVRQKTLEINQEQKKLVINQLENFDFSTDYPRKKHLPRELTEEDLIKLDELDDLKRELDEKRIAFEAGEEKKDEDEVNSFLKSCTRDLTVLAEKNKLDPVVGREKEINRMIQILSRRTKNNPCLVGEPGVGKTAIVEGLAQHIAYGDVPDELLKKHILSLDLTTLVAGTKYRGEFEDRMKQMITALKKSKNIVLFIDEIHMIIGAGGQDGPMDAANMLKPALGRGEIQIIGATTAKEYTKYIEKNPAFERRFQKINVEEPSDKETEEILEGIKSQFEKYHGVIYDKDVVPLIVKLSRRYIHERFLPDKAIDILDEAGAQKKLVKEKHPDELDEIEKRIKNLSRQKQAFVDIQDFENAAEVRNKIHELQDKFKILLELWRQKKSEQKKIVTTHDVCRIIGEMTGIPVEHFDSSESDRLLNMEKEIQKSVIGQEEAVRIISSAIRRSRTGISSPKHPIGSFIFLGPTGVGKTQLAKSLAKFIFGSEDQIIRIDMSDFMEKHNVSRLIGAPPGYIGYEEGGILTEKVRRHPYSVLLLDEIEKAHPDVFNILLQLFEEGELSDNLGHTVNFRNTIVIMTSNAGARQITNEGTIGFSSAEKGLLPYDQIKTNALSELKKLLSPELLNRIDDVVVFRALEKTEIAKILELKINELAERLSEKSLSISLSQNAKDYLAENGYEPSMGARPMSRLIQKEIEEPLSLELLAQKDSCFSEVVVELKKNEISVHLEKKEPETETIISVVQKEKEFARK